MKSKELPESLVLYPASNGRAVGSVKERIWDSESECLHSSPGFD